MPTIFRQEGYRFFFYSNEGAEPLHVHIESNDCTAKFWLDPIDCAESHGYRASELRRLRMLVIENRLSFMEAWHDHFKP